MRPLVKQHLQKIIDYGLSDEKKNWEEVGKPKDHVYHTYNELNKLVKSQTKLSTPQFYPTALENPCNAVQIHPVQELEEGTFEIIEQGNEDFWAVYIHHTFPEKHGALRCVADVATKEQAEEVHDLLINITKYYKK